MLQKLLRSAAVLLAASAVGVPSAEAQRVDPNRIVDLHVNAEAENTSFDLSTLEGRRSRMTFAGHGTFEISPVVTDRAGRRFRLTIYKGPENAKSEDLQQVEQVNAQLGVPVAIRSMPTVSVIVDGIRQRQTAAGQAPSQFQAPRSFEQMVGRCGKQVKDEERILTPRAGTRTVMAGR